MKKAVGFITVCLMAAAVAACAMPFKENRGEASGLSSRRKNEPVFGSVPYFQDNTGRLVQTEDGYFYGYWGLSRFTGRIKWRELLI